MWKDIFHTKKDETACIQAVTAHHKELYTKAQPTLSDKLSFSKAALDTSSLLLSVMTRHFPGLCRQQKSSLTWERGGGGGEENNSKDG